MKRRTAEITLYPREKEVQKKIQRKLSWRDSWIDEDGYRNEIVYEDYGGDIRFFYDGQRMVPHVIDVFYSDKKSTYSQVKKFAQSLDVPHTILSDVPNSEVIIRIEEEKLKKNFDNALAEIEQFLFGANFCNYDVRVS